MTERRATIVLGQPHGIFFTPAILSLVEENKKTGSGINLVARKFCLFEQRKTPKVDSQCLPDDADTKVIDGKKASCENSCSFEYEF